MSSTTEAIKGQWIKFSPGPIPMLETPTGTDARALEADAHRHRKALDFLQTFGDKSGEMYFARWTGDKIEPPKGFKAGDRKVAYFYLDGWAYDDKDVQFGVYHAITPPGSPKDYNEVLIYVPPPEA